MTGRFAKKFIFIGLVLGFAAVCAINPGNFFGGIQKGIDLAGGAELRYKLDVGQIERRIRGIREELQIRVELQKTNLSDEDRKKLEERQKPSLSGEDPKKLKERLLDLSGRIKDFTDTAVDIIRRRIDPAGIKQIVVNKVGTNRVTVQIPFRVPKQPTNGTAQNGQASGLTAEELEERFLREIKEVNEKVTQQGVLGFYEVSEDEEARSGCKDRLTRLLEAGGEEAGGDEQETDIEKYLPPKGYIYCIPQADWNKATNNGQNAAFKRRYFLLKSGEKPLVLIYHPEEDWKFAWGAEADGKIIDKAWQGSGSEGPQVNFMIRPTYRKTFGNLTSRLARANKRFAVVLDGVMYSAPNVRDTISDTGQISGSFTTQEAKDLAHILTAGSLPVQVREESQRIVGPATGQDNIERGFRSILIAVVLVLVFMAMYYLACGLIADLALIMNLVLLLGAMSFMNATLTLPGMAGILLTMGMAVDANVLIFERVREELARGRNLRMAVQVGYDRAFSAIIDGNITTLLTALVLYNVGTGAIRGFALTLIIGIVASLFTALYGARVLIEWLIARRVLKQMRMLQLVKNPQVQFFKIAPYAITFSVLVVAGALVVFNQVGDKKYSIDFVGGTQFLVEFRKAQPQEIRAEEVKQHVEESLARAAEAVKKTLPLPRQKKFMPEIPKVEVPAAAAGQKSASRYRVKINLKPEDRFYEQILEELITELSASRGAKKAEALVLDTSPFDGVTVVQLLYVKPAGVDDATRVDIERARKIFDAIRVNVEAAVKTRSNQTDFELDKFKMQSISDDLTGGPSSKFMVGTRLALDVEGYDTGRLPARNEDEQLKRQEDVNRQALALLRAELLRPQKDDQGEDWQLKILKTESIGRAVASDLKNAAILSVILSLIVIFAYILLRFDFSAAYGMGAIVALFHDVIITVGAIVLFDRWMHIKIDLNVIAALLTIVGYSLNDTIVVYDRIRENRRASRGKDLTEVTNTSLNQTLARTLLTSFTTLLAVSMLFIFGGGLIRTLAFPLLVGVLVGTYSSIFIATPVMVSWTKWQDRRAAKAKAAARR